MRGRLLLAIVAGLALLSCGSEPPPAPSADGDTTTPIKHVVVIFGENISFDHYFGTYPNAVNGAGETPFTALPGTPAVDGLTPALLTANPNGVNPKRIPPNPASGTVTCDNDHGYSAEQKAFNGGLMDKFPTTTGVGCPTVMDYFDGNTVTGLWNLAQHYAMSDHHFGTAFGPSTPGHLELVSGDLTGVEDGSGNLITSAAGINNNTVLSNRNPPVAYDRCSGGSTYAMSSATNVHKNVGDLLNAKGVTWGWFQGGFRPTARDDSGHPTCGSTHSNVAGRSIGDYDPHHNPFAYYQSTTNPDHLPPTPGVVIGGSDAAANHQYDLTDFDAAVAAGQLPAVSFLKAPHYQDAHPGYSDPIDEQHFIVDNVNAIMASSAWDTTAVFLAYDDSDGWYDHFSSPIVRTSQTPEDFYSGAGHCGTDESPGTKNAPDRCGYGPRLPLVVVSPYARQNFVDTTVTDQTSILRFIEDNWTLGRIGGNSVDVDAGPLTQMFDFAGAARAPAIQLRQDGTVRCVLPACTPEPTPTATATATATPAPDTKPRLGKLACAAKVRGRKVRITCKVRRAPSLKTSLRLRLKRHGRQLATRRGVMKGRRAVITLKLARRPRHGVYKLVVTIAQPHRMGTRTLRLKL